MASTGVSRIEGLDPFVAFKAPCKCATTANITLSGAQTIDGVALTETTPKTRVLVKNQTSSVNNGIYDVYDTAWVRSSDFNGSRDVVDSTLVSVDSGTLYGNTTWRVQATNPVVIGTSAITFTLTNNLDVGVAIVASFAALASTAATSDGILVTTRCHTTAGFGGNDYISYAAAHSATNGGQSINSATAGFRWRLLDESKINDVMFGVVHDGTNQSAAMQLAINYCASFTEWPDLTITGKVHLTSSLVVDRPVGTHADYWTVRGQGKEAGFYTPSAITLFTSSLAMAGSPLGEVPNSDTIYFEDIIFRAPNSVAAYCFSKNFLICNFHACKFQEIRFLNSSTYAQSWHFSLCTIREQNFNFIACVGCYDIIFTNGCTIENNYGGHLLRSVSTVVGANGVRLTDSLTQGMQVGTFYLTGCNAVVIDNNHIELNAANDFNFFGGVLLNHTITVTNNFIATAGPTNHVCYFGPTNYLISGGNAVEDGAGTGQPTLYTNAVQVVNAISLGDNCTTLHDATVKSLLNGITRFGNTEAAWTHNTNQFTKDVNGCFGFNSVPVAAAKVFMKGANQTAGSYSLACVDGAGNNVLLVENDRQINAVAIGSAAGTALTLDASGYIKTLPSSLRYKENVKPIDIGLEFINALVPVEYNLKLCGTKEVGLIAEDMPDTRLVSYLRADRDDPDSALQVESIKYGHLTAPLVKAVQELTKRLEKLEKKK